MRSHRSLYLDTLIEQKRYCFVKLSYGVELAGYLEHGKTFPYAIRKENGDTFEFYKSHVKRCLWLSD